MLRCARLNDCEFRDSIECLVELGVVHNSDWMFAYHRDLGHLLLAATLGALLRKTARYRLCGAEPSSNHDGEAQDRLLVRQHAAPPGGFQTPLALQALSAVEQTRATQADALLAFLQLFSHRAFICVQDVWTAVQPSCACAGAVNKSRQIANPVWIRRIILTSRDLPIFRRASVRQELAFVTWHLAGQYKKGRRPRRSDGPSSTGRR